MLNYNKKIFFSIVLCFTLFSPRVSANPQYNQQWPISIYPDLPSGRLKKVKESAYMVRSGRENSLKGDYFVEYIFDDSGYLLKIEYSNPDRSKANTIEYIYKNGQLFQKNESFTDIIYSDSELFEITDQGLILTVEKIFSSGSYGWRYENTYDSDGRIIRTDKFDKFFKWKLVYSKKFFYNDEGLLSANESFGMDSGLLSKDEFFYDDKGNIEKSIKYNSLDKPIVKIINKYDSHGNYLRREFFDKDGISFAVYSYTWKYDNSGNWITKVIGRETLGSEAAYIVPKLIINREIEYCE